MWNTVKFQWSLACENSRGFSSLFAARNVSRGGTSATERQKFHTDDVNNISGSHGVPEPNLFNFTILLVDFTSVCVHLRTSSSKNQMLLLEKNMFHQFWLFCVYIWPSWPFVLPSVFCLSFVNNSTSSVRISVAESQTLFLAKVACQNIRFFSLFALRESSLRKHPFLHALRPRGEEREETDVFAGYRGTSSAAKSEEKRLFSQGMSSLNWFFWWVQICLSTCLQGLFTFFLGIATNLDNKNNNTSKLFPNWPLTSK